MPENENYYYSNNVTEATNRFVAVCNYANGSIEYINHTESGVNGEQLQATVCAVGDPKISAVVYTISGTHGIEGYAGSMAQISMLRGNSSMYPSGVRMVHLHLINPYGASYILKENEQNADQLKNEAMYYDLNYDNPILQEFIDRIDLPNMNNASVQQKASEAFNQLIATYGSYAVNLAFKTGQGKRPRGIAYFGPSKSWSSQTEDYVVNKYLSNATNILVIDWHTAVGPYGVWSFMPVNQVSENAFRRWAPKDLVTPYDLGIPTGGRTPYSTIQDRTGARNVFIGLWEAGTYNATMETNTMLILRLHCRFYGNRSDPFCANIISQTKEYFYPQAIEWKKLTFDGINDVVPRVLSGFAAEANIGVQLIVPYLYMYIGAFIGFYWSQM